MNTDKRRVGKNTCYVLVQSAQAETVSDTHEVLLEGAVVDFRDEDLDREAGNNETAKDKQADYGEGQL